jgi:hypothetical protein
MEALPWIMGAVSAAGAMASANAQSNQAKSAANAAGYNAEVDRQKADVALQQAGANEEATRRRSAMVLGQAAAGLAQNGTGLDGSGLGLYEQSAQSAELDALNIRYGGQMQSQGFQAQRGLDLYSQKVQNSNASAAMSAGWLNAGSAALSGYASGQQANAQAEYYKARPSGTGRYGS